jgi:hypothetical protein
VKTRTFGPFNGALYKEVSCIGASEGLGLWYLYSIDSQGKCSQRQILLETLQDNTE